MTETKRIRWAESSDAVPGYGAVRGWRGHAGSCDPYLFLITKRSLDGDDYALCTELPWMSKKRSYDPDPDKLKAEAERWLERFVSSLGAVLPDEADPRDPDPVRELLLLAHEMLEDGDDYVEDYGRRLMDMVKENAPLLGGDRDG